ncbi:MAG: hypothetical protein ACK4VY_08645 [Brevundimonas sp.]
MSASEFQNLFESSPRYRRWFKAWWEQDFSTSGRKASLQRHPQIQRSNFAGREWPAGWTPPHDLKGNPNPSFQPVNQTIIQQYAWQYYRSDLNGCFIEVPNLDALLSYTAELEWCAFTAALSGAIGQRSISLSNSFFAKGLATSVSGNGIDLNISSATILGSASVHLPRNSKYQASSTYIDGDAAFRGEDLTGQCDRLFVRGTLEVNGGLSAIGLKSGNISIVQPNSRSGNVTIYLSKSKVKNVKIAGSYNAVSFANCQAEDVSVLLNGAKKTDLTHLKASSLVVYGPIQEGDFSSSIISGGFTLRNVTGKSITLNDMRISGGLIVHDVEIIDLFMDRINVAGQTIFSKNKFSDNFFSRSSEFLSLASFSRCAFPGGLNLSGTKFLRGADFRTGSGSDVATDPIYSQVGEADFSGVLFGSDDSEVCANFDGRKFPRSGELRGSQLQWDPEIFWLQVSREYELQRGGFQDHSNPNFL